MSVGRSRMVNVRPMSMVVDVTAIVLVLRVAVVDGGCLEVVQHARQASQACTAPALRSPTVEDDDGNEVVTNTIHGNLNCAENDPAPQVGDSEGSPNRVTGVETGQCLGLWQVKGRVPQGPSLPLPHAGRL